MCRTIHFLNPYDIASNLTLSSEESEHVSIFDTCRILKVSGDHNRPVARGGSRGSIESPKIFKVRKKKGEENRKEGKRKEKREKGEKEEEKRRKGDPGRVILLRF